jgi:hypothetical protein
MEYFPADLNCYPIINTSIIELAKYIITHIIHGYDAS